MNRAGQSVLWFLGACLVFSDGIIAVAANISKQIDGGWILVFGFLVLIAVLCALLYMFKRDPAFLIAERGDLVSISLIRELIPRIGNDPKLISLVLDSITQGTWNAGGIEIAEEDSFVEDDLEEDLEEDEEEDADDGFHEEFSRLLAGSKKE